MQSQLNFWRRPTGQEHASPTTVELSSGALKEFLGRLSHKEKAVVLDLGPAVGPNVEFFFGLGMKLYVGDLLEDYSKPKYSTQLENRWTFNEKKFLDENFKYPKDFFDGLICWDLLSYLDPKFANTLVARLSSMMKSKSLVFGLFQTKHPSISTGLYKHRILSETTLERIPIHSEMEIQKVYQTRDVIQLFSGYESQKFSLLKHNLLAVLLQKR